MPPDAQDDDIRSERLVEIFLPLIAECLLPGADPQARDMLRSLLTARCKVHFPPPNEAESVFSLIAHIASCFYSLAALCATAFNLPTPTGVRDFYRFQEELLRLFVMSLDVAIDAVPSPPSSVDLKRGLSRCIAQGIVPDARGSYAAALLDAIGKENQP